MTTNERYVAGEDAFEGIVVLDTRFGVYHGPFESQQAAQCHADMWNATWASIDPSHECKSEAWYATLG